LTVKGLKEGEAKAVAAAGNSKMAAELRNRRIAGYDYGGELAIEDLQVRPPAPPPKWRRAVENSLWLTAASFVLYYGDGHANFFSVLISNPRVIRYRFNVLPC
jgi:hypothetical protein